MKEKFDGSPFSLEEFRSAKDTDFSFFFRLKSSGFFFFEGKGEDPLDRVG